MNEHPLFSPVRDDKYETQAEIIHNIRVTLRQLKWTRRAIRSGQFQVPEKRRKAIAAAIDLIEKYLIGGK